MTYVFFTLIGLGVCYLNYIAHKSARIYNERLKRELKYQRHLRNAFDYQIQMYAFMDAHDAEGFRLASEQVSDELNKCEELLKHK